tara:strand:- start:334 stop:525 length:192 start_codon:yes stop_codon:yes gene_type:complete
MVIEPRPKEFYRPVIEWENAMDFCFLPPEIYEFFKFCWFDLCQISAFGLICRKVVELPSVFVE